MLIFLLIRSHVGDSSEATKKAAELISNAKTILAKSSHVEEEKAPPSTPNESNNSSKQETEIATNQMEKTKTKDLKTPAFSRPLIRKDVQDFLERMKTQKGLDITMPRLPESRLNESKLKIHIEINLIYLSGRLMTTQ